MISALWIVGISLWGLGIVGLVAIIGMARVNRDAE